MRTRRSIDPGLMGLTSRGLDTFTLAGRTQVSLSALTGRVINLVYVVSQSNGNNSVNLSGSLVPATLANASKIFNTSIAHRGAIFQAVEPLLASDNLSIYGHRGVYLADALITEGYADSVNIVMGSWGGSYIAQWCPGGGTEGSAGVIAGDQVYRIELCARCLYAAGLGDKKTAIISAVGESSAAAGTTQVAATAFFNGAITECKRSGLLRSGTSALFVDQTSNPTLSTGLRNPIRAAQAAVVDGVLVKAGVDLDPLSGRTADGVHFTPTGAAGIATASTMIKTYFS